MKYKFFFFLIISFSISHFLFAEQSESLISLDDVFESALFYEKQQNFSSAITEWKRFLFLQNYYGLTDLSKSLTALEKISDYYIDLKQNKTALSYINEALTYDIQNPQVLKTFQNKKIILLEKESTASKNLLRNDIDLYRMAFVDDCDFEIKKNALYLILENDIKNDDFNDFIYDLDTAFSVIENERADEVYSQLLLCLLKIKKQKLKNPKVAAGLSLIPGLGQIYADDFSDGINAFLLNGSLIALSAYSLINLHFIEFSFFEFNPLYRFYRGNFYNAQKDSYEYNKKKTDKIKNEMQLLLKSLLF